MSVVRSAVPYISTRYLYRLSNSSLLDFHNGKFTRGYAQPAALPQEAPKDEGETEISNAAKSDEEEGGRMSKRLAQITDEAVEQGGRGAEKAIQEAGFSQALKKRLEARIQESTFKSDNPAAYAQVNISVSLWSSR